MHYLVNIIVKIRVILKYHLHKLLDLISMTYMYMYMYM
jgi:hypothetical protein